MAVAVAACAVTGPAPAPAGDYVATSYDARPLPHPTWSTPQCDASLLGAALHLGDDGTFTLALDERIDCGRGGGPVSVESRRLEGTFADDGGFRLTVRSSGTIELEIGGRIGVAGLVLDVPVWFPSAAPTVALAFERS